MTAYPDVDGSQPCAHVDPEWFFPQTKDASAQLLKKVRPLCSRCPFRNPCLAYAMTHPVMGIWGGTTEAERARIRQQQDQLLPQPDDDRPMWRQAVEMRAEGLSVREIADQLGTRTTYVHSMLSRHRARCTAADPSMPDTHADETSTQQQHGG